ncbi:hypothetical protein QUF99_16175 [Bacillus sp. DX4.1]|uniref:hypothetical protein n=1 Tax=Bacillus sp. DX4.1 TaxID=3055867 RepID=UPI00259FF002|nr:hypothetical protein [Bacillus sp. DX4.1]MDM5188796.1 hypothetical protein [Bacillus sp. DX4.1]
MFEYGIVSSEKDEKLMIKNVENFLSSMNRTLSKNKNKSVLEARFPNIYKYIYFNLNKEKRVYLEIHPNNDLEGKYKFESKNINWIIFFNKLDLVTGEEKQEEYIKDILDATKFEYVLLKEYAENEERL